ncbi:MAG TPA: DUF3341 domain-containing protein [Verrucomicrobia bacterium]|nr:DUF3341 domain-containing protein [Verrucomicrobiota bacterium]
MPNKSVFCITKTHEQAERIVEQLKTANFSNNDISVLFPDKESSRDFAHEKHTKAPEGAITGVGTGGVIGGALGWVAGIGALAIPGVGPFIAAGPIMAALSGAAVGATVGGIAGGLIGLGIPELEAKRYEGKVKKGNILISVHTEDSEEIDRAKDIFTEAGAEDICSTGEASTARDLRAPDRAASQTGATSRSTDKPTSEIPSSRRSTSTSAEPPTPITTKPTYDEVARRAYELYLKEGCPQGREKEHWREAEEQMSA